MCFKRGAFIGVSRSVRPERMRENFAALDFVLDLADIGRIAEMDRSDGRLGPYPETAEF